MVNAWSLAASILDGTFDEDYPLMDKSKKGWSEEDEIRELDDYYDFKVGSGNTAHSDYYYDYTRNDPDRPNPFGADYLADVDDQRAHHFGQNTVPPYITKTFKYEEDVILKQAEDYIAKTYELHYTGDKGKMQTLDLIESIGDAEAFCRSNAIKYLSRFGKKDGKNRKDILKAIHYCTLLYHFSFNDDSN